MTLHARGVPYHVVIQPNAVLDVAGTAVPILTIEPGVTIEFDAGAEMRIDPASSTQAARGGLVAIGTAAEPIAFTSANHVAGAWLGIYLGGNRESRDPDPARVGRIRGWRHAERQ